jgi:quinoprotein relay system zinc metallohydrolase 2
MTTESSKPGGDLPGATWRIFLARMWLAVASAAFISLPLAAGPSVAAEFTTTEVAPGVHVHHGLIEERTTANLGDQANIGFIVGERCVAVIDTGGSRKVGDQLRSAITRVTPLPVCYVINTHVHPDHLFGNAAFLADKPQFIGHDRLAGAISARGRNYLNSLVRDLGDAAAGSELVAPTRTVADRLDIDLGGRVLAIRAWPVAHTDNDLTVWDSRTGTLWLSDLLFMEHTPALDGRLKGWLAVMQELKAIEAKRVVPGHGPVSALWPDAAADQERYLGKLLVGVRAAIKAGTTIEKAVESVGWDEEGRWREFRNFHRRNVTSAYADLEWE